MKDEEGTVETKRTTKYFGEVELKYEKTSYGDHHVYFYPPFKDQQVFIYIENCNNYGDKLGLVWELVDKYIELHEIAKKAIVENFPKKKSVVYEFFKYHFDDNNRYYARTEYYLKYYTKYLIEKYGVTEFKKIDIASFVEKMEYPGLYFNIEDGIMTIALDYHIYDTGYDLDVRLDVLLNEAMQVTEFEIDWGS